LGRGRAEDDSAEVTFAAFSPGGDFYATVHFDTGLIDARHAIRLGRVGPKRQLRLVKELMFKRGQGALYRDSLHHLVFSPDGKRLATRHPDDLTTVWETATGKKQFELDTRGLVVGFTPDSRRLVSVSRDGLVQHWDFATKRCVHPPKGERRSEFLFVNDAIASTDGTTIAITDSHSVVVKNALSGKTLRRFDNLSLWGLALAPNGKMLAAVNGGDVVILDTLTGKEVARRHEPVESQLRTLAFSPEANFLAAGGSGGCWAWSVTDLLEKGLPPRREVAEGTLEARVTSRKSEYKFDLGGQSAEEFAGQILRDRLPPAPAVDLVLTLKNTGNKTLVLDPEITIDTYLIGEAAMNHPEESYQSGLELKEPKYIRLAPGQTHSFAIDSLDHGHCNRSYWLRPGEYTLYVTGWAVDRGKDKSVFLHLRVPPVCLKVVDDE
jgi:hypothetical protein